MLEALIVGRSANCFLFRSTSGTSALNRRLLTVAGRGPNCRGRDREKGLEVLETGAASDAG